MKIQPYNNFWQRIHNSARNKGFPLRVMFEITYRCNFHCRHCYMPQSYRNRKGELKTKEVFFILDQLSGIGCFYLGFTGGEPFMRRDILDILGYARKLGFEIIIYTNGSLIDEEIAKQLSLLRPNIVDITIPGMSRLAFERVSRVSGSRDKVFRAIDLLHKKRINLGFKTCVLKENKSEIKQIQDFARSLGALHRLDNMLSPCLDGSEEPYRYRGALKEDSATRNTPHTTHIPSQITGNTSYINQQNCDFGEYNSGTEHRIPKTDNLFKCGVGVSQAAITPFGELKMCLMIDYPKYQIATRSTPHASGSTLKEAWEKLKELVRNIRPDENYKCNECELEPYCKWCPAKPWLYNRTFTSCEPEIRKWAEIRRQKSEVRGRKTEVAN